MAVKKVTRPPAPAPAVVRPPATATLPLTGATPGLVSPYDGSTPIPGMGLLAHGALGSGTSGQPVPQINATNQTALATNGDIDQSVKNENTYKNVYNYYVASPYGYGGMYSQPYSGWGAGYSNGFGMDPYSGALLNRQRGGVLGWLQRVFRGY